MTIAQELDALGLPGLPEALPRPVIDNHTHADETTRVSSLCTVVTAGGGVGEGVPDRAGGL